MKLYGAYDLNLYKQLVTEDASAILTDRIITNDIELTDNAAFYMITGANNGGKTTFNLLDRMWRTYYEIFLNCSIFLRQSKL